MDSMEAAARFRLSGVDEQELAGLKAFAMSQGSRNCANLAAMVLWSLLGSIKARDDLIVLARDHLGQHPVGNLLLRCAHPPDADEEQLIRSGAFCRLFQGSS
jgi:hypothetical protein